MILFHDAYFTKCALKILFACVLNPESNPHETEKLHLWCDNVSHFKNAVRQATNENFEWFAIPFGSPTFTASGARRNEQELVARRRNRLSTESDS
jgi:hypothetical protein